MLRHVPRLSASLTRAPTLSLSRHSSTITSKGGDGPLAEAPSQDIAILGGGITGLAAAYYLTQQQPHRRITLYESSDRLGGWLSSTRVPVKNGTVLFEAGPRTLRPSSNGILSTRLLQELDLAKDAIFAQNSSPAARSRYIYYPDHIVRLPHPSFGLAENLWNLMTEPVFKTAAWSGLREMFVAARDPSIQDESVGEFFARRASRTLVDRLLSAIFHGIYAGDVWQLSAKSLFPGPWRDEVLAGSLLTGMLRNSADGVEITKREADYLQAMKDFQWDPLLRATLKDTSVFTLNEGLGMLPDRMVRYLSETGSVQFKTSTPIQSISPVRNGSGVEVIANDGSPPQLYSHIISALSPAHLNSLHKNLVPYVPTVNVMTINLYFRSPNLHPEGFGYLIPQATPFEKNPERALGVVFDTAVSPSPESVDMSNWQITDVETLKASRDEGRLVNINDFSWYNLPDKPNVQDHLTTGGTKLTVMLGGHWWNGWPAFPDEQEGLTMAKSLLARHLNINEEPEAWRVNMQRDCIPQYTVGHEQRLMTAHNNIWTEYKGRLRVAGNWMSGVGVNDCLRSAWEVVRGLTNGRGSTGLEHVGSTEYVRLKPVRASSPTSEKA